ncbi:hypothetical protein [Nitriliruptor alkaliphilus]|uniref:hypothetical protein n=1 Tax=Nitriliruptor alkaliphilus TaxID=427918 RepID=UPI000696D52D|nr:hypothetical protein [Nitriliruptor alkaliphilus]
MLPLPAPVLVLAERQLGLLARFQLRRWLRPSQIDGYVRRGHLVVVERGIYRAVAGAIVGQQAAFAAALRSRPSATITGPAVLGHLGVDGFTAGAPFEILVAPGRTLRNVGFPWRVDPRPDRAVLRCGEVRLTRPEDALVHSVRWRAELGDRALRLGCHWLGWRGLIDRDRFLHQLVARSDVDPDAARFLEVMGGVALGRCESDGERHLGDIALGFLPAPRAQVWLRPARRSDWLFLEHGVALEYQGDVDHGGIANAQADAQRERELLEAADVVVLNVTDRDLRDESALVARIVTELTLRAYERGIPTPTYDPKRRPGTA